MHVGWHYLGGPTDTSPPLGAALCLDNDGAHHRGHPEAARSPHRMVRIYYKGNPDVNWLIGKATEWALAGWKVQLGNEPNLPLEEFAGGPPAYRALFKAVSQGVKRLAPNAKLFWAGMSPGVQGWREWYEGAHEAGADGIVIHAYGNDPVELREPVWHVAQKYPTLEKWVGEVNFAAGRRVSRDAWAEDHFKPFLKWAESVGIFATTYFAYVWPTPDMDTPTPVDGRGTAIERVLREWRPAQQGGNMHYTTLLKEGLSAKFGSQFFDVRGDLPPNTQVQMVGFVPERSEGIAVHHTATSEMQTWGDVWRYHQSADPFRSPPKVAWRDIAYNVGISDSGVFLLRDVESGGNHVYGMNEKLWAIALLGTFTSKSPPDLYYQRLRGVIEVIDQITGKELTVKGHADWALPGAGTSCPGTAARAWCRAFTRNAPPMIPLDVTEAARNAVTIPLNAKAAVWNAAYQDGFTVNGPEVYLSGWVAQSAEHPTKGKRVYAVPVNEWDKVVFAQL